MHYLTLYQDLQIRFTRELKHRKINHKFETEFKNLKKINSDLRTFKRLIVSSKFRRSKHLSNIQVTHLIDDTLIYSNCMSVFNHIFLDRVFYKLTKNFALGTSDFEDSNQKSKSPTSFYIYDTSSFYTINIWFVSFLYVLNVSHNRDRYR